MEIQRPIYGDREEIRELFLLSITDTFRRHKIDDPSEIQNEVDKQLATLDADFEYSGKEEYFLVAKMTNQIVGTIAHGTQNKMIIENLPKANSHVPEIKSVYVLPEFQGTGVGTQLWTAILQKLAENGVEQACLDSGYAQAQKFWNNRVGEPIVILSDVWGPGQHYMIWLFNVEEQAKKAQSKILESKTSSNSA